MAIVHFESLEDCDLVEVEFVNSHGSRLALRLFVDSGFTGTSSFVLSHDLCDLALANLSSAHAAGALTGRQERVLVRCSIPAISFERLARRVSVVTGCIGAIVETSPTARAWAGGVGNHVCIIQLECAEAEVSPVSRSITDKKTRT